MMDSEFISISKMARLHHLTRQTLIYYDHIDLLKPVYVNEHGYRYYSAYQIPFLREICLLKELGVKLEDIKNSIENRNPDSVVNLLEKQKIQIEEQIQELNRTRMLLQQRINFYEDTRVSHILNTPIIKKLPPRKVFYMPFTSKPGKDTLRLTLMKAWNLLYDYRILPSSGFGTLIRQSSFCSEDFYKSAGIFIILPDTQEDINDILNIPDTQEDISDILNIPDTQEDINGNINVPGAQEDINGSISIPSTQEDINGNISIPGTQEDINGNISNPGIEDVPGTTFACMYKYSFPYDKKDFCFLKEWIHKQNYEIIGDALDVCLLDATFYTSENEVDYCCLQIPVRKK
ncbi:helix-turn-helix domain-containing protein [Anaerocolumna sp. AGMB13020]|uniref:MerR family transcriptional regulator n=1 Tax=Anaerocolumna sp. AGMB13020 TaxID=3081750 RepID=UPI002953BCE3|nr:helix-turn-helix domain-containing protein [Anaerocolumna sp. AGMB13020]WOO38970.1 helix-turn-helix domain-containing protein [Anaerocolumna sp. AGMB13020]